MAPTRDHVVRCTHQTEELFDLFLSLKDGDALERRKRDSDEKNEVHQVTQSILVRDNGVPLHSSNDYSNNVISRSPVTQGYDERRHSAEIQLKRRSLEIERSRQTYSKSPSRPQVPRSVASPSPTQHPLDEFKRERTHSVGPTDDQLKQAAVKIAEVGDRIEKEYADRLGPIQRELVDYLFQRGRDLTYEQFAVHVNDLIGEDRNWTNFMFAMHLGRRVAIETHNASTNAVRFFRTFIGEAFGERIAEQEDVVQFVNKDEEKDS